MKKLWLIDVDDTVLNKEKMWRQLSSIFVEKFPQVPVDFKEYYLVHRGRQHSVDLVKESLKKEFGIDEAEFKNMFNEVNYAECFDHEGWQRLTESAESERAELAFFTQGTEWVQQAKRKQLTEIVGDLPWHIYEKDKMGELRGLMEAYQDKGIKVSKLVDDLESNRQIAESEHGLNAAERL